MTEECVIIDSGLVCAAGNQQECRQRLAMGSSALTPFSVPGLQCLVGKISTLPGDIGSTARLIGLIRQGLDQLRTGSGLQDTHLVVATTKGAADQDLLDYTRPGQGHAWQVATMIAAEIGTSCPHLTVSAACASGTVALIQAAQMIDQDEAKQVLVVGIDILSRFVLAGFSQLQALASGHCRPFDRERDGLCLGEGIGLVLLTSRNRARRHHQPVLAAIKGWGVACDAGHITAPCRRASGLTAALRQAVGDDATAVGAINAHGTGTIYNDAMEITAFTNVWGSTPPPFYSVKGAMGHCLGAAGVIEACLSIQALAAGEIPGTVGLREADQLSVRVKPAAQKILTPAILTCNSGFGGINAALLLGP